MEERSLVPLDEEQQLARPVETAYVSEIPQSAEPARGPNILKILLRRWPVALLLAVLLWGVGLPIIWTQIKPVYTATSTIQIRPVVDPVLYVESDDNMPYYRQYMNTQAAKITSEQIILPMLEDPRVVNLNYFKGVDNPVQKVKENMVARGSRRNQLLMISMKGENPQEIAEIVNATVRAYMRIEVQKERADEDDKIRLLERKADGTAERVRRFDRDLEKMSKALDFGLGDLNEQEKKMLSDVQNDEERLIKIRLDRVALRMKLELAKKSATTTSAPMELIRLRINFVNSDPLVASLTSTLTRLQNNKALMVGSYREDTLEMRVLNTRIKNAQKALEEAKLRALEQFREILRQEREQKRKMTIETIQSRLAELDFQEKMIRDRLAKMSEKLQVFAQNRLAIERIKQDKEMAKQELKRIKSKIQRLTMERDRQHRVTVIERAYRPRLPSDDKRLVLSAALILGSLVFGFAFTIFLNEVDLKVENPLEVESRFGLQILGTTPRLKDLDQRRIQPRHFVDDCRTIRVNLSLALGGDDHSRTIVVASPEGRDGKTMLAINLATSIALTGKRVVLVDGDLRKPDVARYLKLNNSYGVTNVLAGECPLDDALQGTRVPTLFVLPCNRTKGRRGEILLSKGLHQLIAELQSRFDEVIIDTPAVLAMPDAALWASISDGIVMVARSGKTGAKHLLQATTRIKRSGAKILGLVLTGTRIRDSYEKYHQRYQAGYFDAPLTEEEWNATQVFLLSRDLEELEPEGQGLEAPEGPKELGEG